MLAVDVSEKALTLEENMAYFKTLMPQHIGSGDGFDFDSSKATAITDYINTRFGWRSFLHDVCACINVFMNQHCATSTISNFLFLKLILPPHTHTHTKKKKNYLPLHTACTNTIAYISI